MPIETTNKHPEKNLKIWDYRLSDMPRAMEKLYICYAESRRIYGREMFHKPSRFIREMPAEGHSRYLKSAIALQRPADSQTGACGLPPVDIRQNDGIFAKTIN
ncbi:hypothetical protein ACW5WN_15335 [Aeromonas lacus]|uniref:hypothetical protein n=1 Tax=Aeromonas lacus TaxID=558884 RepID=UPI00051C09BE|nr:hypothetical protein [Aeromonas lacus]